MKSKNQLTLWLATQNKGKLAEFALQLADLPYTVRSIAELGIDLPKEGTAPEGATLESNARLKAEAICKATGEWALGDDSGLFVEAVPNQLGVDTALYGGPAKLLSVMEGLPLEQRAATFKCTLALARPSLETLFYTGSVKGKIGLKEEGQGGFGYDPVFIAEGTSLTTAQRVDKEGLSAKHGDHRGQAVQAFKTYLVSLN